MDGSSLLTQRESSSSRTRRPCQDAHEKPRLPHPVAEVELSRLPEEEPQANEESKRSTWSAPQCGHAGGGSSDRKTRFSKQLSQQQQ